jgi:hypothetical protein
MLTNCGSNIAVLILGSEEFGESRQSCHRAAILQVKFGRLLCGVPVGTHPKLRITVEIQVGNDGVVVFQQKIGHTLDFNFGKSFFATVRVTARIFASTFGCVFSKCFLISFNLLKHFSKFDKCATTKMGIPISIRIGTITTGYLCLASGFTPHSILYIGCNGVFLIIK